jgi:hypothetical protein
MSLLRFLSFVIFLGIPNHPIAATISFEDAQTSFAQPVGVDIFDFYGDSLGVRTPNLRFHDSTHIWAAPFNFIDGWGAVVNFGTLDSTIGHLSFDSPVNSVRIDAHAQSEFDLNGAQPFSWSVTAFDKFDNQVAFQSANFGFDFAGVPNNPAYGPYALADLSLTVSAYGAISRLEISVVDRVFGIDTIYFDGDARSPSPPAGVPEAAPFLCLVLFGFFSTGFRRRK